MATRMPSDAAILAACGGHVPQAWLFRRAVHWARYMRIEHGGRRWIVKTQEEWAEETGLSLRQVQRGLLILRRNGLVEYEVHRWGRNSTATYLRLTAEAKARLNEDLPKGASPRLAESGKSQGVTESGKSQTDRKRQVPVPLELSTHTQGDYQIGEAPIPGEDSMGDEDRGAKTAVEVAAAFRQEQADLRSDETLEKLIAAAHSETKGARSVTALARVWRAAWAQAELGFCEVTQGDQNRLRTLSHCMPAGTTARVLADVVGGWEAFRAWAKRANGHRAPTKPVIWYLAAHRDTLREWWLSECSGTQAPASEGLGWKPKGKGAEVVS